MLPGRYHRKMDKRIERLAAVHVDLAVNIAGVFGTAAGVMSLLGQGIHPSVLQRVFIEGGPRRGAPPLAVPSSLQPPPTDKARPQ